MTASCALDIPDHLTVPQFFFDFHHPTRPRRARDEGCLIDDASGNMLPLRQLHSRSTFLANAISLEWGIGAGDVVALLCPNHVDVPVVIWAVHRLGGIITLADPTFSTTTDIIHQLRATKTTLLIIHPDFLDKVDSVAKGVDIPPNKILLLESPKKAGFPLSYLTLPVILAGHHGSKTYFAERTLRPGEAKTVPAFYFFSNGISGVSKCLSISHYAIIANIIQRATHFNISAESPDQKFSPGNVSLAVLPLSYLYGLMNLLFLLYCGMSSVVVPKFDFKNLFTSIAQYRVTHLFLVPAQIILICKNPLARKYNLSHVKYCVLGGQAVVLDSLDNFNEIFPNCDLGQIYGLSEMSTAVAITPALQKGIPISRSVGKFLPDIRYRIVKPDGSLAVAGEEGELYVSGPAKAIGYPDNGRATTDTFTNGWIRTGDSVIVDDDDNLFIVGRCKPIFKVRGFQVSPEELETHIRMHPNVDDVCVVGVPDLYSGEVPVAFVVLSVEAAGRIAADHAELQKTKLSILQFVAGAKAQYKWISGGIQIMSSLPVTSRWLVDRELLRQQAIAARRGPT